MIDESCRKSNQIPWLPIHTVVNLNIRQPEDTQMIKRLPYSADQDNKTESLNSDSDDDLDENLLCEMDENYIVK